MNKIIIINLKELAKHVYSITNILVNDNVAECKIPISLPQPQETQATRLIATPPKKRNTFNGKDNNVNHSMIAVIGIDEFITHYY